MAQDRRSLEKRRRCEASAAALVDCLDMLIEILLRLPAKQIFRTKAVSKEWYSIISDPIFVVNYAKRNSKSLSGFVLNGRRAPSPEFFFVSLRGNTRRPARDPEFINIPQIKIQNICKGLLCYSQPHMDDSGFTSYYVCNPTSGQTKRISVLDHSDNRRVMSVDLAFDPLKSAFYNLIFVTELSRSESQQLIKIGIYSSKTQSWSYGLYNLAYEVGFGHGVHCKGAIYWSHVRNDSVSYFDLEANCIQNLGIPQMTSEPHRTNIGYLGESGGRLHLVRTCRPSSIRFIIFEMKDDRSGWLVKCQGDFGNLVACFPRMGRFAHGPYQFNLMNLFEGEREEDLNILLKIPGGVVQYNAKDKTSRKLRGLPRGCVYSEFSFFHWTSKSYQCIETLACI
ncbi:F-box protein At5g07610-like [Prunus avium]|uniref:F-box protein At5g07610-like n=1 Tax=Prunus avium TaxID=42229 RepID=A0A6P5TDH0_PRUAV|nr:F-box protein At5g07610-like [Prunus avium]